MPEAIAIASPPAHAVPAAPVAPEKRLEAMLADEMPDNDADRAAQAQTQPEPNPDDDKTEETTDKPTEPAKEGDDADPEKGQTDEALTELEVNGETYKVPQAIAEGFMRQRDYTQKTQAVAEKEKAVVEREQVVANTIKFHQAITKDLAQLQALDSQLDLFAQVNWTQLIDQDPQQAQKLSLARGELERNRNQLYQQIQGKQGEFTAGEERRIAQARAQGNAQLAKDIKGWNQDMARNIGQSTMEKYGFSESELNTVLDPRMVRVLHDAYQWNKLQASKPAVENKVRTAPKVLTPAGAQATQQVADNTARTLRGNIKKSGGATSSVENYLAHLLSS